MSGASGRVPLPASGEEAVSAAGGRGPAFVGAEPAMDLERRGPPRTMAPELALWDGAPPEATIVEQATRLGLSPLAWRLLASRGVDETELELGFLRPVLSRLRPPQAMAGFDAALSLLEQAFRSGWRVGIFGDYDVDGVSTTALLTTFLEALGVEVVAAVADREGGYGLSPARADRFAESGVQMLVTGDVGTSDVEAIARLRSRGVHTIVIDHHQVPEVNPPADAFINPHQLGCGFPFKGLCSAGVAFYLCAGLRTKLAAAGPGRWPDPRAWLDLVALATVCDMMPLRHENRVLTRAGLRQLSARARPGLRALLEVAGIGEDQEIDEAIVGFKLGPRLNAPGRLGPAEPALRLLRARSDAEARALAESIEALNLRRRRHSDRTFGEALRVLEADPATEGRAGLVVADPSWLPGVVGISAAGLAERFGRPVVVLAIDLDRGVARGSARSAAGVDVRAALEACAPVLDRFGGHREAAGVELRADRVPAFAEAFDAAVSEQRRAAAAMPDREVVDLVLPLSRVDEGLCTLLRDLAPWGMGLPQPRFAVQGAQVERVRVLKERHVALTLGQGGVSREAIAFGQAHHGLAIGEHIDCVFVPGLDSFRGQLRLRLQVERLWRSSPRC